MDKTAIKNFAIEARKILRKTAITEAGFYGITKDGCKDPIQKGIDFEVYETVAGTENRIYRGDIKRRANLVEAIRVQGFDQVIEETAYTWFNRIIAIRFMEVNNYLPTRVRVLSSETGNTTPDIILQADNVDLNLTAEELEKIHIAKNENRYDDAFRILFVKQCNELNTILPGLFEKTDDYMELLLKISYTGDGVIRMLIDSIPEDNFNVETEGQVEIIGWMYQYYNTELKDDTFAKLKKNIKITKERIPAATQLFTPDWIVRYMVENSLGRVWIEHLRAVDPSVDEKVKAGEFGWKYYLPEAEQETDVQNQLIEIRKSYKDLKPQDITCIDPCMGSGHILVYMFDVLMNIYRSEGFSEREAVFDILEKNIRGLDIDRRAYQLSYFALMMKARGYNRVFFRGHEDEDGNKVQASPCVYSIDESNLIDREHLNFFGAELDEFSKNNAINQMNDLLDTFKDAKEYGSILSVKKFDFKLLRTFLMKIVEEGQGTLFSFMAFQSKSLLKKLVDIGEILAEKYDVVVTNPPYMGISSGNAKLNEYVKNNYPESKTDLFSVFIDRCMDMLSKNGIQALITMQGWMFLSSYEKLRKKVLRRNIVSLLQFGIKAFEEIGNDVVQTASFVIRNNQLPYYNSQFFRLLDRDRDLKIKNFLERKNIYLSQCSRFAIIPGNPIAYWISDKVKEAFKKPLISQKAKTLRGYATSSSDKYVMKWWEVDKNNIGFGCKNNDEAYLCGKRWFPYNKGGFYRKWYGNNEEIVDYYHNGENYRSIKGFCFSNQEFYFLPSITWTKVCTGRISVRYNKNGFIFGDAGPALIANDPNELLIIQAMLNSKFAEQLLAVINPTLNYTNEAVGNIPVSCRDEYKTELKELVERCIYLMKEEWDSFETSWDFKRPPLAKRKGRIREIFQELEIQKKKKQKEIRECEERINQILVKSFELEDEVDVEMDERDICISEANLQDEVKALLSYAVGCMFGRYNIDKDGVQCTSNECNFDDSFVDKDNVIPISSDDYFEDEIVSKFVEFIRLLYGEEYLLENLEYIGYVLSGETTNPKQKIRDYYTKTFYSDHLKLYTTFGTGKRPIYWMFTSGDENGFKCLIYLHRYSPDIVGLIRSDYLTKTQTAIENALKNAEFAINTSSSAVDKAQATKKRDKFIKQLAEIRAYYPALSHIALQRIDLNLDDGVKANYEKFQGIEVSIEGEKKRKIDLLAKI